MEEVLKRSRSKIYVPHPDLVWMEAELIAQTSPGVYQVEITEENHQGVESAAIPRGMDSFPLQNDNLPQTGVEDMSCLNYLHEASILDNLRKRFLQQIPYTYT